MGLRVLLTTHYLIGRILVKAILDIHKRGVKIKCFSIQMLLQCIFCKKGFMKKYLCWFAHWEPYVLYETMVKKIVGSTSSISNVHEVVDNNSNPYINESGLCK